MSSNSIYCYKKRVFDEKLVLIGEGVSYEDRDTLFFAPWNPKIVGAEECSTKNTYYPDFYDGEGNILKVDSHAYEVQLYVEPPSNNFFLSVGNLPLTTGMINTETPDINGGIYTTYWDTYVDNRVIEICY